MSYLGANVGQAERAELATLLPPAQLALFLGMPRADQRHGLDVATALRRAGYGDDRELIVAGILHDVGKGRSVRLWHRVAWSLGQRHGRWLVAAASVVPGARQVFVRLERHPRTSAELVRSVGAPARTVALIAQQADPRDPAARALHLADEGELDEAAP